MLKIALVGNIASGKSTVESLLENKGYVVFDTDLIAHDILKDSQEVFNLFKTNNRKEIANIVFSNKEKLKQLEAIIHPLVKERIEEIFKKDFDVVFISVPQLYESGFDALFDKTIYITADEDIRINRLMQRNGYTEDVAKTRINAQKELNKKELADFVIENNSDLMSLEKQLDDVLLVLV